MKHHVNLSENDFFKQKELITQKILLSKAISATLGELEPDLTELSTNKSASKN